jgi:DNA-binding NtrC family response regulator
MLSPRVLEPAAAPDGTTPGENFDLNLQRNVDRVEEQVIRRALAQAGGNQTKAAKILGISRNGLADKMRRLGIDE